MRMNERREQTNEKNRMNKGMKEWRNEGMKKWMKQGRLRTNVELNYIFNWLNIACQLNHLLNWQINTCQLNYVLNCLFFQCPLDLLCLLLSLVLIRSSSWFSACLTSKPLLLSHFNILTTCPVSLILKYCRG